MRATESNICCKAPRPLRFVGCAICYPTNLLRVRGEMAHLKPRAQGLAPWERRWGAQAGRRGRPRGGGPPSPGGRLQHPLQVGWRDSAPTARPCAPRAVPACFTCQQTQAGGEGKQSARGAEVTTERRGARARRASVPSCLRASTERSS